MFERKAKANVFDGFRKEIILLDCSIAAAAVVDFTVSPNGQNEDVCPVNLPFMYHLIWPVHTTRSSNFRFTLTLI